MSDFNEVYNIKICKDKCNFICVSTEYRPDGFSYYKCSNCENNYKSKSKTMKDIFKYKNDNFNTK